jgi:hypothetical protein
MRRFRLGKAVSAFAAVRNFLLETYQSAISHKSETFSVYLPSIKVQT